MKVETDHWDETFETFMRQHLPYLAPGVPLEPDRNLLNLGLDSLLMVSVMVTLESEYGISFPDEMLTLETFSTAGNLWGVVSSLRDTGGGGH